MKTNRSSRLVKFAVLALLTTALAYWAGSARPQALRAQNSQTCSNSTLKGTYIESSTGTVVGVGPAAVVNGATFDGSGNATLFGGTISIDGAITTGVTGTGTYTVSSNCTGSNTFTLSTGAVTDFNFLVNVNGANFSFITTDSGFVASGEGTRLSGEK